MIGGGYYRFLFVEVWDVYQEHFVTLILISVVVTRSSRSSKCSCLSFSIQLVDKSFRLFLALCHGYVICWDNKPIEKIISFLCQPLRKIISPHARISPPISNKPPTKNSFLQINRLGLIRGFMVSLIC